MKLTLQPVKIKANREQLLSFLQYLNHLSDYLPEYLTPLTPDRFYKEILKENLKAITEQVIRAIFNNSHKDTTKIKIPLKLSHEQRIVLIVLTSAYPLPLDINFIEYEIKNKLVINF